MDGAGTPLSPPDASDGDDDPVDAVERAATALARAARPDAMLDPAGAGMGDAVAALAGGARLWRRAKVAGPPRQRQGGAAGRAVGATHRWNTAMSHLRTAVSDTAYGVLRAVVGRCGELRPWDALGCTPTKFLKDTVAALRAACATMRKRAKKDMLRSCDAGFRDLLHAACAQSDFDTARGLLAAAHVAKDGIENASLLALIAAKPACRLPEDSGVDLEAHDDDHLWVATVCSGASPETLDLLRAEDPDGQSVYTAAEELLSAAIAKQAENGAPKTVAKAKRAAAKNKYAPSSAKKDKPKAAAPPSPPPGLNVAKPLCAALRLWRELKPPKLAWNSPAKTVPPGKPQLPAWSLDVDMLCEQVLGPEGLGLLRGGPEEENEEEEEAAAAARGGGEKLPPSDAATPVPTGQESKERPAAVATTMRYTVSDSSVPSRCFDALSHILSIAYSRVDSVEELRRISGLVGKIADPSVPKLSLMKPHTRAKLRDQMQDERTGDLGVVAAINRCDNVMRAAARVRAGPKERLAWLAEVLGQVQCATTVLETLLSSVQGEVADKNDEKKIGAAPVPNTSRCKVVAMSVWALGRFLEERFMRRVGDFDWPQGQLFAIARALQRFVRAVGPPSDARARWAQHLTAHWLADWSFAEGMENLSEAVHAVLSFLQEGQEGGKDTAGGAGSQDDGGEREDAQGTSAGDAASGAGDTLRSEIAAFLSREFPKGIAGAAVGAGGATADGAEKAPNSPGSTGAAVEVRMQLMNPVPDPKLFVDSPDTRAKLFAQWSDAAGRLYRDSLPTNQADKDWLVAHMREKMQTWFRGSRLHVFGSSGNRFGTASSDIDMCLEVTQGYMEGKKNPQKTAVHKITARVRQEKDPRTKGPAWGDIIPIAHARVPIVKMKHNRTGIEVDICINNMLATRNTGLLRTYAEVSTTPSFFLHSSLRPFAHT